MTDAVRASARGQGLEPAHETGQGPAIEPEQGCRLGGTDGARFELLERLGGGGMAVVFRAHDAVLDRIVAIKFLVNKALGTREGLERLQLEARACGRLNHENIVRLFDMGTDRGLPFLVLEYLEGRPLDAIVREGDLDARRAVRILIDVARGLSQAHRAGIVHRDLKPSNVFIAQDGTAKILDFGVATMTAAPGGASEPLWGTPRYMSPEQWKGEAQDARTDIWSAGVMFFRLMTGVEPFSGASVVELRDRVISPEPAPSLRALRPELPEEAERIARRAMMKNAAERFHTADELEGALIALEMALTSRAPREPRPKPERRQITVLSCSLYDPSEPPAHPSRKGPRGEADESFVDALELCATVIQELDGAIVSSFGSRVLACFGYPIAHEDSAARAVHAAFRIVRAMLDREREAGRSLGRCAARIGIDTHLSIVHRAERPTMPLMLQGEALRVAQWLEERAGPNEILVGHVTQMLVRSSFDLARLGEAASGGAASPEPMYRALRPLASPSRFDLAGGAARTPLVGRDPELSALRAIWNKAMAGRGQFVLLLGEAGIGKSRLLRQHLEGMPRSPDAIPAMVHCQCWPHFQNSALQPIIEGLRRAIGLRHEASPEEKLSVLERLLAEVELPAGEHTARWAALFEIATCDRSPHSSRGRDWLERRMLDGLVTLLVRLAARRRLLLIVEDAHWSDGSTLELLRLLLAEIPTIRAMVLVTARPELEPSWHTRSPFARSPCFSKLVLTKLSPEQTATMIALASRGRELPAAMARQLVQRADGVPLFIEELTRWIVDATEPRDGAIDRDSLAARAIPATLEDLLRARLDALPADAQDVAHLAAVLGRDVPYELLGKTSELGEESFRMGLAQLLHAGVLRKHENQGENQGENQRVHSEARYVFGHALVRDAAYQSLVKRKREHLHRRVADVLLASFPELVGRHPELVAAHFAEAGAHEEAVTYFEKAGQRALRLSAYADAAVHFERASTQLRMLPENEARGARERELQLALGTVLIMSGKPVVAVDIGQRLAHRTDRSGSASTQLLARIAVVWSSLLSGCELTMCRNQAARALALHDRQRHEPLAPKFDGVDPGLVAGMCLLWSLALLGELDRALASARDLVQRTKVRGDTLNFTLALFHLGYLHVFRGELEKAERVAGELGRISERHGYEAHLALAMFLRGWCRLSMGHDDGLRELEQGVITRRKVGTEVAFTMCLSVLAWGQWHAGRRGDALRTLDDAMTIVESRGERFFEPELLRVKGEILLAQGADASRALSYFERGRAMAIRQGAKAWELRLAFSNARLLLDLGRREEAKSQLTRALAGLTEAHDTSDIRRAKQLLVTIR